MQRGPGGTYAISTAGGERVQAFVPARLPPTPAVDLSGECQPLLERALLACGELGGLAALLPDRELFLYAYVRREAVLSSQIEGTQSSLSDLLLFELDEVPGVPLDDVTEVSNYIAALEHGLERLRSGFPLSSRLLREVHEHLMAGARGADKEPGAFRRTQNWLGGTRPGNARFVPPPATHVQDGISDLEHFINGRHSELPALVQAAIAHVQFETIHPFLDGNGRVGRLLIVLMLHEAGVLREPLLYLSLYLKQNRDEYYRLLDLVRRTGDWEAWIAFFLEGVAQTAGSAVETAHRLLALFREDEARVRAMRRSPAHALRAFACLREIPVTTINDLARRSEVSYPTAAKIVGELTELGLLREVTGRRRGRVFAYDRYLAILAEGTEPL